MGKKAQISDLNIFEEEPNIVYHMGEYYWIGDDECPYDFDEETIDINRIPAFRRTMGIGYETDDTYVPKHEVDSVLQTQGRKYVSDEGILPDTKKRVYKIVDKKMEKVPFVVWNPNNQNFYCIKNGCYDCKYENKCGVTLEKHEEQEQNYAVMALDVSAQEPAIFTLSIGKEPMFLETFRNRSERVVGLTKYIDLAFIEEFKMDIDKTQYHQYWLWIDQSFHVNPDKLVRYNFLIEQWIESKNDETKNIIKEMTNNFYEEYQEFLNNKNKKDKK